MPLLASRRATTLSNVVFFFTTQSFLGVYDRQIVPNLVTAHKGFFVEETNSTLPHDLTGCPAGLALVTYQQAVSFVLSTAMVGLAKYVPKQPCSREEATIATLFGCTFALHTILSSMNAEYIDEAAVGSVRACLPLSTSLFQQSLSAHGYYPRRPSRFLEAGLMSAGVVCAVAFALTRLFSKQSSNTILGFIACLASLLCESLNLALAGVLSEMQFNVYDIVAYMAVPATVFMAPLAMLVRKPVPLEWRAVLGTSAMTDFGMLMRMWALSGRTAAWHLLSGVLAFAYSVAEFSLVREFSPSFSAFAKGCNDVVAALLTERLPVGSYLLWAVFFAAAEVGAFSAYCYAQAEVVEELLPDVDPPSRGLSRDEELNLLSVTKTPSNGGSRSLAPRMMDSLSQEPRRTLRAKTPPMKSLNMNLMNRASA